MVKRKLSKLFLSLVVVAVLMTLIAWGELRVNRWSGKISPSFTWIIISYFASLFGAAILFILRLARYINAENNFLYMFLATTNFSFGLFGIFLFFHYHIDISFLHTSFWGLLTGTILFADIFYFNTLFNKPGSSKDP